MWHIQPSLSDLSSMATSNNAVYLQSVYFLPLLSQANNVSNKMCAPTLVLSNKSKWKTSLCQDKTVLIFKRRGSWKNNNPTYSRAASPKQLGSLSERH